MLPQEDLPAVRAAAGRVQAAVDDAQIAALAHYRALVLEWNQRINLTAIRDPDDFERLHLVDAVGMLRAISQAELARSRLADIGAGAGLPGIPLAILAPGVRLTLIEATGKKATFLQAAVDALSLPDVQVLHGRAEELAQRADLREQFDIVTARALAEMPALVELCLPFCRIGGRLLAAKKLGIDAELQAARRALEEVGGAIVDQVPVALPGLEDRQIVVITKQYRTPARYPRRSGLPAHQPLR